MKKKVEILVERVDKKDNHVTDVLTAVCTVWDKSGNGWLKIAIDDETYWFRQDDLKKVLRISKKVGANK